MLANRFDYLKGSNGFMGVGLELMEHGWYREDEVAACLGLITKQRKKFGDGVVVLDVGANIGSHTIPWARSMYTWGIVIAIEPQERIFYALAGNIAMNNCYNARAIWAAVGSKSDVMDIPVLDYQQPANFGGLSLLNGCDRYDQPVPIGKTKINVMAIDDLELPRLDFIKIDVQGMEADVLNGSLKTIARCNPIIIVEVDHGTNDREICSSIVGNGYSCNKFDDMNLIFEPLN